MSDPRQYLPENVWLQIMSRLSGKDLLRSFCAHSMFAQLGPLILRPTCEKRWLLWFPTTASAQSSANPHWRQQLHLLDLRGTGPPFVTDLAAIDNLQKVAKECHRRVLVEWLIEVSRQCLKSFLMLACIASLWKFSLCMHRNLFKWHLESVVVSKAMTYLDHCLSQHAVKHLHR